MHYHHYVCIDKNEKYFIVMRKMNFVVIFSGKDVMSDDLYFLPAYAHGCFIPLQVSKTDSYPFDNNEFDT